MKNNILAIFIIQLLVFSNICRANDYSFELISPESGFAYNQVQSIVLDHNGMVWFGCSNKLYTYNSDKVSIINTATPGTDINALGNINKLYIDDKKLLWICTNNGLFTFDRNTYSLSKAKICNPDFKNDVQVFSIMQVNDSIYWCKSGSNIYTYNAISCNFKRLRFKNSKFNNGCRIIVKDKKQTIWFGMSNGQVYKYDASTDEIHLFHSRPNAPVTDICVGELYVWIGYEAAGVDKLRIDKAWSTHYGENKNGSLKLLSSRVRKIIKRENGEVWIGTDEGINVLNEHLNTAIISNQLNKLPYNSIFELVQDNYMGVWVGTWAGGLAYYNNYDYRFKHIKKIPFDSKIPKNNISSFVQDNEGTVWIATENAGLKSYYAKTNSYNSFEPVNDKNEPLHIKSIAIDNQLLYIGTVLQGLWIGNKQSMKFEKIDHPLLETRIVHKILINEQGVWIAVYGKGVLLYHPETKEITVFNHKNTNGSIPSDWIRTLYFDSNNNLWVGSDHGLSVKMHNSNEFKNIPLPGKQNTFHVNSICQVAETKIWVATKNRNIIEIDIATLNSKLPDWNYPYELSEVFSIQSDNLLSIWLSTAKGIIMYAPDSRSFSHFSQNEISSVSGFNPNASLKMRNGKLLFGSTNGYIELAPDGLTRNPLVPNIYLSEFNINNTPFEKNSTKDCNSPFLADLKNIALLHTENNLSFSFVTNNYVKPSQNKYRYRLLNYQDEWVDLGTKNEVSFTKIPHGEYELQVLGSNNNDLWATTPYTLKIYIAPPFWRSTVAYISYILILIIGSYFIFKELRYRAELKRNILVERVRHEAEEELFVEKQKFFTNISHELRTPLTLIISPLNVLLESLKYSKTLSEDILVAQRNADRLLRLTNEILDMRSIENGTLKLKIKNENIVKICQQAYSCFTHEAREKKINYTFLSKFEECNIEIDGNKIEKVIFNLLSNAFKFTDDERQIILSIDFTVLNNRSYEGASYTGNKFEGECLEIKVKNFGKGIEPKELKRIFDRFSTSSNAAASGTGLGLHIAKEYIDLHKGNIFVFSQIENETVFSINLPAKSNSEIVEQKHILIQTNLEKMTDAVFENEDVQKGYKISDKVILIVEDNRDLRKYLQKELIKHYKVLTAVNGKQGFEIALEVNPDIIVSDIMMPIMDGNELTKKIKTTPKTEDIPVILLTALADKSSKIDGLRQGADAYMVKPVDLDLLLAQIKNLMIARDKITQKLINQRIQIKAGKTTKPISFIDELENIIIENISNPNFGMDDILKQFNMSRSSFYRKLKNDYNQTITEFIKDVRLKRAIELIKSDNNSLDEIAFLVGFNSYSYFSRVFKQKYGKSPKQFSYEL